MKGLHGAIRTIRRARAAFPDTAPRNLRARYVALERRRAKNRVARASRKGNRR